MRFWLSCFLVLILAGCGGSDEDGPVDVAIITQERNLVQQGIRLSTAAQHVRGATHEGLVALDPSGQIIPAAAERWIITDDGSSYIFRLRNSDWPDGTSFSAADVRRMMRENLRRLEGTSLGMDLAKVTDVRAMTGRVVEIRLSSPMPDFLRLLAQPELGFVRNGNGIGPMQAESSEDDPAVVLRALPPEARGLPSREDWEEQSRALNIRPYSPQQAVAAFSEGEVDLVLNGRLASLPLADTGPLTRGTIRLDATLGMFGLLVRADDGLLGTPERREAISMAIDRTTLMETFNIGGWSPSAEIVPRSLWVGDVVPEGLPWGSRSIEERRSQARGRISAWQASSGEQARVTIGLPAGPGSEQMFRRLARDLQAIGVAAQMVPAGTGADLVLHDRVARFASPRWFFNQLNCEIKPGPCSPEADRLVEESLAVSNAEEKASLLAQAQLELQDANVFIPFGAPIRWALARGSIAGFEENAWGFHPLFPLSEPTI